MTNRHKQFNVKDFNVRTVNVSARLTTQRCVLIIFVYL